MQRYAAMDALSKRISLYLHKFRHSGGRRVQDLAQYALRGAAFKLGTGAVSLLILWIQARY